MVQAQVSTYAKQEQAMTGPTKQSELGTRGMWRVGTQKCERARRRPTRAACPAPGGRCCDAKSVSSLEAFEATTTRRGRSRDRWTVLRPLASSWRQWLSWSSFVEHSGTHCWIIHYIAPAALSAHIARTQHCCAGHSVCTRTECHALAHTHHRDGMHHPHPPGLVRVAAAGPLTFAATRQDDI